MACPGGYGHPAYAQSLAEFGTPFELTASGGWLLKRPIEDSAGNDAMGPYPLFCCTNWQALSDDMEALTDRLVSVVLVADPFGAHDEALLRRSFDRVVPFKAHFGVDLYQPGPFGSRHHRYYAERAFRSASIEICAGSEAAVAEWTALYGHLIQRHAITGIQAFSPESFRKQFAVPGLTCLRASASSGECVGMHLWFVDGEVAYSHLAAANQRGYELSCSYALYSEAIRYFQGKVHFLDLGGTPENQHTSTGLAKFKQGWANTSRTAFLCGRILNPRRYEELTSKAGASNAAYFPAYRYRDAG